MSPIDLAILGFIKKKSMSAYELAKFVEATRMKNWMKIGSPTVYQNLKKLAEKGYLSTRKIKEGNMPEKAIYSMTASGEEYFLKLMEHFSEHPGKIYFDFNACVGNLQLVDQKTGLRMLHSLRLYFSAAQEGLNRDMVESQHVRPAGKAIMKLYQRIFAEIIEWSEELIEDYQQASEPSLKYVLRKELSADSS
jgi:DNA-binding PadR family transcriptional regulator